MKKLLLPAALLAAGFSFAENQMPVVQTKFTADPAPMVYNDTVFLYTSHDEDDAEGYSFKMFDWLLYTTTDMVNWTEHPSPAKLADFSWRKRDNGAWAIQVVERNGKFYMYCPLHGNGIGVLVADSPYGPFHDPLGKPLLWQQEHWYDIDPTVWIDDDGQAYLYWGNPHLYGVKLNDDMISYSGDIIQYPHIEDYQEGPWFFKRDGKYYLAFASTCCPEGIGYAMSDSPTGPWEYKSHIMDHTDRTRGNHPGICEYKGKYYVMGHSYDIMRIAIPLPEHHERRSVNVAEMTFNPDGTIVEVPYWADAKLEQIEPFKLDGRPVQAETMAWGYGLKSFEHGYNNMVITNIDNGEYIKIQGVDFGSKAPKKFMANVATDKPGAVINVRINSADGPIVASLAVKPTGSYDVYKTLSTKMARVTGVHDLYLTFEGTGDNLFNFDWWQIK